MNNNILLLIIGLLICIIGILISDDPPSNSITCPVNNKPQTIIIKDTRNNDVYTIPNTSTRNIIIESSTNKNIQEKTIQKEDPNPEQIQQIYNRNIDNQHNEGILREYDYKALYDKLTPPRQRNLHEPGYLEPSLVPIYTKGLPTPFRKVGLLTIIDNNDENEPYKFLNLIGSKLYSGQFNYYAVPTKSDDNIKFNIDTKKELFNKDTVTIDVLGNTYEVNIDDNALPLYYGLA